MIFDVNGNFYDGMDERLGHLRLSTLANDSSVRVINGKISGIYEKLPMLEMGDPIKINNETSSVLPLTNIAINVKKDSGQIKLKMVWDNFTEAIYNKDFKKALDFVDEKDLHTYFITSKGNIKAGVRVRLTTLDTAIWSNLDLKNGKLLRVWLNIPPATSLEEKTAKEFINNLNKRDWIMAMKMLTDYEREYLSNENGTMKEKFKKELQSLTSKEWDSFFLFRGKLSGALEWMGIGQYGQETSDN